MSELIENNGTDMSEILSRIQCELNIEKKRENTYLKYKYRNSEDIMAGIKPLLKKYGVAISIGQDVKEVGGIVFLQIILKLQYRKNEIVNNYFCPVEALRKEGQSMCQAFGATISYANKYALASMFLLDEGIDADTTNIGNGNGGMQRQINNVNQYKPSSFIK